MRVTLESTTQVVTVVAGAGAVPARVWEGHTESGIKITVLVTRIAVDRDDDTAQFEAELVGCRPPAIHADAWPTRVVL